MSQGSLEIGTSRRSARWRVAVLPSGTEVGLEIHRALATCKEVDLVGLSARAPAPGPFVYSAHRHVPDVRSSDFRASLLAVVSELGIDFVFPANPLVIDALLDLRDGLPCRVALARSELVRTARSKSRTYALLADTVPVPRPAHAAPAYVKPDALYGAQGGRLVSDERELLELAEAGDGLLVQELLPGREWTVDCLSGSDGRLLFASARTRERVRMGTSMWSEVGDADVQEVARDYASRIAERLPLDGPWFFQMKEDADGVPRLLEVDPRIAGTMCLHRARGVNFPLLGLYVWSGEEPALLVNETPTVVARSLRNHFGPQPPFGTVYVDLDETLVVRGQVNPQLVGFLFACRNRGVRIVLLSKCEQPDPESYLRELALDGLLAERIWLDDEDSKADHIDPEGAIFIDDSFSQRREVAHRHGIPTFAPDMVDALALAGS